MAKLYAFKLPDEASKQMDSLIKETGKTTYAFLQDIVLTELAKHAARPRPAQPTLEEVETQLKGGRGGRDV